MRRNIWLISIISICIILTGCDRQGKLQEESVESQMIPQEMSEENIVENLVEQQEESEEEKEEEILYLAEDYGEILEYGSEFYYEEDVMGFYYNVESFYLNSDFLYTMNETLDRFYDDYLYQYQQTENWYLEQGKQEMPEGKVPYSELLFLGVQYVDNDYVSLLFNDVSYMGGAHPYSMFDAITIDRHTGEEVNASEVLRENDDEILDKVNVLMGLEEYTDWAYLDFYLQEGKIVFFYRLPGYWEDVVLER